jgi:hypothetical protein
VTSTVTIDTGEVVPWNCREMTSGMAYRKHVYSAGDRGSPNTLTREEFQISKKINSQG